jgi:hypothetical protein
MERERNREPRDATERTYRENLPREVTERVKNFKHEKELRLVERAQIPGARDTTKVLNTWGC